MQVNRGPYCRLGTDFLLTTLRDGDFGLRKDFRVTRRSFVRLQHIIQKPKHHGWQAEVEILAFLFWLASGCCYRVVMRSCGIPLVTVCDIVHRQLNGKIKVQVHCCMIIIG